MRERKQENAGGQHRWESDAGQEEDFTHTQMGEPKAWVQKTGGNSTTKFESGGFPGGSVGKTLPSNAEVAGSLSGQGAKTPHAKKKTKKNLVAKNQKIKQKQYCNKFNKDFEKRSTSPKKNL